MTNSTTLADYTYMKTGGPADEIVEVTSSQQLQQVLADCRRRQRRYFILGGGSNTLFTDAGFRGLIILNRMTGIAIKPEDHTITVESGCPINRLVNTAASHGLAGIEWFLGLPGTVGGAIYNNSHFKTHLFGDVVTFVNVITTAGDIQTLTAKDCEFAYDSSRFHHSGEIIISATLTLTPDEPQAIKARAKECLTKRSTTQPLSQPSSGCMFQNPPTGPSAGQLIDAAGLKGHRIGGAMVSPIHANFIVNTGQATSADIQALAQQVESTVFEKFGVSLKKEVFYINEFGERMH